MDRGLMRNRCGTMAWYVASHVVFFPTPLPSDCLINVTLGQLRQAKMGQCLSQWARLANRGTLSQILNLALMSAGSSCSLKWQYPRFVAKKRSSVVRFHCYTEYPHNVTWFREQENQEPQKLFLEDGHILQTRNGSVSTLTIQNIQFEDNGIYYCKLDCKRANLEDALTCGSELRVLGVCKVDLGSCSHPHPLPSSACLPGEVATA